MPHPSRFDCHVHSLHSPDGRDSLEAFAAQIDAGVADGIGFAEHYDFLPLSGAWRYLDEAGYLADVAGWVDRGYRFFAGVEVDYATSVRDEIRTALQKFPFAFAIGSIHTLPSGSVSDRGIEHFRDDAVFDRLLSEYEAEFTASLTVPEFAVVGHPGVFQRYLDEAFFAGKPWRSRIRDLEASLAEKTARSDKLLEVNTSGYFSALGGPCATEHFLECYRRAGGDTLTLSSDAHAAGHLRRGFPEAAALLERLGFRHVYLPWDRSQTVALEGCR